MVDWYLEALESDSAIDWQKSGLKSMVQSVSWYLKDTLDAPTEGSSHRSYTQKAASQIINSLIWNSYMNTVMYCCKYRGQCNQQNIKQLL